MRVTSNCDGVVARPLILHTVDPLLLITFSNRNNIQHVGIQICTQIAEEEWTNNILLGGPWGQITVPIFAILNLSFTICFSMTMC